MDLFEEQRENWGTRGGFVLAAVGSAVGLGNLWGFPYKLYSYGGGAFLIPYIVAMLCIGIPMLILEFSLGHFTQRAAPNAFAKTHKKLEFAGWWGIVLGFVIITYYPVILAYCFSFMKYSLDGIIQGGSLPWAGRGIEGVQNAKDFFFTEYLGYAEGHQIGPIRTNLLLPLIIAWVAMYFCIFKGVKLVGKIVWLTVPLPFFMLVVLMVRGLTLPGSMDGLVYYLDPVWSELAKPTTWRFAFGQVFFSLSLAFGVMITYASFLHSKSDLNNNAAIIGLADFGTSFIAGIAIFATLGAMAFATTQSGQPVTVDKVVDGGPGLAFVAFPYALAQLPGAAWWSFIFFFTLITLGIDSAFSITESVLASIIDKTGWRRDIVLPAMSLVGLLFGLVYITTGGGLNWLGTVDAFINGTWGIAFLGLLECVVLGWFYRLEKLRNHANERSDWNLGKWWNFAIRVIIPIVLGTLFVWSLFDDFTAQGGFIKDDNGDWIIPNCVGLIIVILAPIVSIIMSVIKSPVDSNRKQAQPDLPYTIERKGSLPAKIAFLLTILSLIILVVPLFFSNLFDDNLYLIAAFVLIALFLGLNAVIISSFILETCSGKTLRPSVFAPVSGIVSTLVISICLALILMNIAASAGDSRSEHTPSDQLSVVSYIILSVVLLIITAGLGWCFYRAMMAAARSDTPQPLDDENE